MTQSTPATPARSQKNLADRGSVHDGFDNLDSDDQFAYDVETHTRYWIWHVNTDVGGERNLYTPLAILQGVDTLSADDIV